MHMKERLIVRQVLEFLESDTDYRIALIAGLRKTGKTTALKQIQGYYPDSVYIDLSAKHNDEDSVLDMISESRVSVLLLDEISFLENYEMFSQALYNHDKTGTYRGMKIVITGSSSAHIVNLHSSKLGGGRSKLFRLPPLTFVEYLYLTDKIPSYSEYESVTVDDFADYLRLEGLRESRAGDLALTFDENYFDTFYDDVELSNRRSYLTNSIAGLQPGDLTNLASLIAYKLSEACGYWKTMSPKVGGQEKIHLSNLGVKATLGGVDLSDAMLTRSISEVIGITPADKGRILSFLLRSGLATVELPKISLDDQAIDVGTVVYKLQNITCNEELEDVFKTVSICLASPLLYTRIGDDILERMNVPTSMLNRGMLLGKMLEVYVRGALSMQSSRTVLTSMKLQYQDVGEVDIYDSVRFLLCEVSSHDKKDSATQVHKYFREHPFIRICSSKAKHYFSEVFQYYQIPYPQLCCMIDTGDVFKLKRTVVDAHEDPSGCMPLMTETEEFRPFSLFDGSQTERQLLSYAKIAGGIKRLSSRHYSLFPDNAVDFSAERVSVASLAEKGYVKEVTDGVYEVCNGGRGELTKTEQQMLHFANIVGGLRLLTNGHYDMHPKDRLDFLSMDAALETLIRHGYLEAHSDNEYILTPLGQEAQ